jgi:hypothetical protein
MCAQMAPEVWKWLFPRGFASSAGDLEITSLRGPGLPWTWSTGPGRRVSVRAEIVWCMPT